MKTDPQHERFIQHHGPVESHPHTGAHSDTSFEGSDASVKMVLGSLGIIALTLVITAIITLPIENILKEANPTGNLPSPIAPARVLAPTPRLQVHPWNTFPELRAHEDSVLFSTGTDAGGHTRIPIAQAIDTVASQLKIRPASPEGLTVPGGQGRDFAGSVNRMPASYLTPIPQQPAMIQGEIRKAGATPRHGGQQKNAPQQ